MALRDGQTGPILTRLLSLHGATMPQSVRYASVNVLRVLLLLAFHAVTRLKLTTNMQNFKKCYHIDAR